MITTVNLEMKIKTFIKKNHKEPKYAIMHPITCDNLLDDFTNLTSLSIERKMTHNYKYRRIEIFRSQDIKQGLFLLL